MFRVVALGFYAGKIVDNLRSIGTFNGIRFVYCHTDEQRLMSHGNEDDEHILLTDIAQCHDAIHDDNELMAILVTDLWEDCSRKYAAEIMAELWNYADRTYCFASIPFYAGGHRDSALEEFRKITYWSGLSILQDNLKQDGVFFINRDDGTMHLLGLLLSHYRKGLSCDPDELPFGMWATEKQVEMALMAMYSNNPKMRRYYKAGTFSFHKSTHEY